MADPFAGRAGASRYAVRGLPATRGTRTAGTPGTPGTAEIDDPGATLAVAVVLCALAAVVPLVPMLVRIDPQHAVLAALHAVICALGAGAAVHSRLRPCLLVASVFPYCWLVVPSVYQIDHLQAAWNDPGITADFSATLRAQVVLTLGQGAFLLGYALVQRRRPVTTRPWEIAPDRRRRMTYLAAFYLLGAILLTPLLISAAGGPGALLSSRNEVSQAVQDNGIAADAQVVGSLVKVVPSSLAISASVLALWLVPGSPRGSTSRLVAVTLSAVSFLLLLVVANPFIAPRYFVLAAFGTFALALFRPLRRGAAVGWLTLSVGALLLAYPAANYFRYGDSRSGPEPVLASPDFDGFQQMINTITFVDTHGHDWGLHLVSAVLFFVPRAVWTAKAEPSTFEIATARGYDFLDLSTPFPAESYLAFGWVGVVVILLALGVAWAYLDRAWLTQSRVAVVAAYLAIAQVGLWRGPFGSLSGVFGFTVALLVLAAFVTSGGRRMRDEELYRPRHAREPAPTPPVVD